MAEIAPDDTFTFPLSSKVLKRNNQAVKLEGEGKINADCEQMHHDSTGGSRR